METFCLICGRITVGILCVGAVFAAAIYALDRTLHCIGIYYDFLVWLLKRRGKP